MDLYQPNLFYASNPCRGSWDTSRQHQLLHQKANPEIDPYNHGYQKCPTHRDHRSVSSCTPTYSSVLSYDPLRMTGIERALMRLTQPMELGSDFNRSPVRCRVRSHSASCCLPSSYPATQSRQSPTGLYTV